MLLLWILPSAAQTQDVPSASLAPADSKPTDPDGGNSFFIELEPGQTGNARAIVANPGDQPLRIKMHVRDVVYNERGIGEIVDGEQRDVGSWGKFSEPEIELGPRERRIAEFTITAPPSADPGDHIGAIVAESEPSGSSIKIVKRIAVRIFVTIPGDALRSFEIVSVSSQLDSALFPAKITAQVVVNNTGRIRLRPTVDIASQRAFGSTLLLSRTREKYSTEVSVPWYGGIVRMPVLAQADDGLTRRVNHSKFVIPWGLLMLVATGIGLVFLGKKYWWDRRVSRIAALQADLRRIEALVARRPGLETAEAPEMDDEQKEIDAILAGIKRARRTNSPASLQRLALALHETSAEALEYLIEALVHAEGDKKEELLQAAASYGAATLANEQGVANLPTEVATELMLRASGTHEPRPNGTKRPVTEKPTAASRKGPSATPTKKGPGPSTSTVKKPSPQARKKNTPRRRPPQD